MNPNWVFKLMNLDPTLGGNWENNRGERIPHLKVFQGRKPLWQEREFLAGGEVEKKLTFYFWFFSPVYWQRLWIITGVKGVSDVGRVCRLRRKGTLIRCQENSRRVCAIYQLEAWKQFPKVYKQKTLCLIQTARCPRFLCQPQPPRVTRPNPSQQLGP